jgi:hypothetical protein
VTNEVGNPFESTQPARQYFVGRRDELVELRGYLTTVRQGGATNLYILGGGGDGKTSFLYKTRKEASELDLVAAVITVSDGMQPDDVVHQLVEAVLDEIAKVKGRKEYYDEFHKGVDSTLFRIPVAHCTGKQITPRDIEKDFEFLLHISEEIGVHGFVFCIDEGQRLQHMEGGALLAKLRAAIQAVGKGFMIVLAALEDIIPIIADGYTGIDRFFPNRMTLGPFENDNVAIAAIEKRLEGRAIQFPLEVSELVVRLAERHPKDIVDISHDIYADAVASDLRQADVSMVCEVVYERYVDDVNQVLRSLGELRPNHHTTLRKILQVGGRCTARDIAKLYCRSEDEGCIGRMEPLVHQELKLLVEKDLCHVYVDHHEESFRVLSGLVGYILENELGK